MCTYLYACIPRDEVEALAQPTHLGHKLVDLLYQQRAGGAASHELEQVQLKRPVAQLPRLRAPPLEHQPRAHVGVASEVDQLCWGERGECLHLLRRQEPSNNYGTWAA